MKKIVLGVLLSALSVGAYASVVYCPPKVTCTGPNKCAFPGGEFPNNVGMFPTGDNFFVGIQVSGIMQGSTFTDPRAACMYNSGALISANRMYPDHDSPHWGKNTKVIGMHADTCYSDNIYDCPLDKH